MDSQILPFVEMMATEKKNYTYEFIFSLIQKR